MSLIDPLIWQAINIYREEAINPENPFNTDQRDELLKIADQAEKHSQGVKNLNKFGRTLKKYDNKYEEWGGDMERLNDKIDVVYSKSMEIVPGQDLIKKIEETAKTYTGTGLKNKIRGLKR